MALSNRHKALGIVAAVGVIALVAGFVTVRFRPAPAVAGASVTTQPAPPPTTTTTTTPPPTTTATTTPEPQPEALPPPRPGPPVFPSRVGTSPATATVAVFDAPNGRFIQSFSAPRPFSFAPVVFVVLENPGNGWLRVMLPERPNESTGWIMSKDVAVTTHDFSIDIDLSARYITVFRGKDIFLQSPVVIGTDATPTPIGSYYTTEQVKNANPSGPYGAFIVGLSAHSDVFTSFGGGDGQVGIHGTNNPGLLGSAASNGCIRLTNEDITKLALTLPMGVPVRIHRPAL